MRASLFLGLCAVCALGLGACRAGRGPSAALSSWPRLPEGAPLVVTADLVVSPGRYVRPASTSPEHGDDGVIVLEGLHDVTLDLSGVELFARDPKLASRASDRALGRALVLRDSSDVRVIGGKLSGYAQGVVLERCRDVVIDGMEVDGFFAQRLRGTSAAPDPSDALELAVPRAESWLERYGAAFAVLDSSRVTLRNARARRGQNGLVIARSEGVVVHDCDFSFLSGWGVCLERASRCTVSHNRLEHCARGFVDGRYADPQGSAGIFVAGSSEGNVFAHNRASHCGNGVLVCAPPADPAAEHEPNRWYANELSFAVGASFRQIGGIGSELVANRMIGSLGGGLAATGTVGLVAYRNRIADVVGPGVSILDGRECVVVANELADCDRGIELLGSARVLERGKDAVSAGHWIVDNRLDANVQDLVLESSSELVFGGNSFSSTGPTTHLEDLVGLAPDRELRDAEAWAWLRGPDGSSPSGRAWASSLRPMPSELHPTIGALARFEPPSVPGSSAADEAEVEPGFDGLVLGEFGPWDFESGEPRPASPAPGRLLERVEWEAVWFHWDAESDPRGDLDLWRARRFDPAARGRVRCWSDPWVGAERRAIVGEESFGLYATAELHLARAGSYVLDVISDDGVRVTIDGRVVHEDWTWHAERRETVELELTEGRHELVLEYFQIGDAARLTVSLDRRPED